MVKSALVNQQLAELGVRLVALLDETGLRPTDALWLYRSDPGDWVLLLVTPMVATQGPRSVYERIQSVILANRDRIEPISLADVSVVEPNDPLIHDLRKTFRIMPVTGPVRITDYRVNNSLIEEAIILRLRSA